MTNQLKRLSLSILILSLIASFAAHILYASPVAEEQCELYPMAISAGSFNDIEPGDDIDNILSSAAPGNWGWLSWNGSTDSGYLVESLIPPGTSAGYLNPNDPSDTELNTGDWVHGLPGINNSRAVRTALDNLLGYAVTVPMWDAVEGNGSSAHYQVSAFARIQILSHRLPKKQLSVRFLEFVDCGSSQPENNPPQATADDYLMDEDTLLSSVQPGILGNDFDTDGDPLLAVVVEEPTHGVLLLYDTGGFEYTPFEDFFGQDSFTYSAWDGSLYSAPATVLITVEAVNDPPVAVEDSATTGFELPVTIDVTANDHDPEGDSLAPVIDSPPQNGQLHVNSDLSVTYVPNPQFGGTDTFSYRVSDGFLLSEPAFVFVHVQPAELWTRQFGDSGVDQAFAVGTDATGVYVGGWADQVETTLWRHAFLRKYDRQGSLLWTHDFGSLSWDSVNAVAADESGVYFVGLTYGDLDDPTSHNGTDYDGFVRKVDQLGTVQWTCYMRSPGTGEWATAIALDETGIFVTGNTEGGSLPGFTAAGAMDGFVRRFDKENPDCEGTATDQIGTSGIDGMIGVAVSGDYVYVSGLAEQPPVDMSRCEGDCSNRSGFVRQYTKNLQHVRTIQFGTALLDGGQAIAADASHVYVTGYTDGTLVGLPGCEPGSTCAGRDIFVRSYSLDSLEFVASVQVGLSGTSAEHAFGIATAESDVYVVGRSGDTDGRSGLVLRFDQDLALLATMYLPAGTIGENEVRGVTADAENVYVSGYIDGSIPGQLAAGSDDAFLMKLSKQSLSTD